jgi:SET domain-containing protein
LNGSAGWEAGDRKDETRYFSEMESPFLLPCLYIAETASMGKGVFTSADLPAGRIVEISPVIVMGPGERQALDLTRLHDYIFEWGDERPGQKACCLALGYVSLYNHSYQSNCEYEMDIGHELIRIRTIRKIGKGEELFINYNGDWNDQKRVWFDR